MTYGVTLNEAVDIVCSVNAEPAAQEFRWVFNNTSEMIDQSVDTFTISNNNSTLTYKPITELDYGNILCWAKNDVGENKDPCVFRILQACK